MVFKILNFELLQGASARGFIRNFTRYAQLLDPYEVKAFGKYLEEWHLTT
jgi:hypothetical protein